MKKKNYILPLSLILFSMINSAFACASHTKLAMSEAREKVVKQYIVDLEKADYKHIVTLFEKNGFVISTSRGKLDAREFFYSFLPNIKSANTEFKLFFNSNPENNSLAARFHFTFNMKDGEAGSGEYIDEFVFSPNSTKLAAVYMFENVKF